jgi:hypothetical protein
VLCPWLEFARDAVAPALETSVKGKGRAGSVGALTVRISNPGPGTIAPERLWIVPPGATPSSAGETDSNAPGFFADLDATPVEPLTTEEREVVLAPWPVQVARAAARLACRLPDGTPFLVEIPEDRVSLESEALYTRTLSASDLDF